MESKQIAEEIIAAAKNRAAELEAVKAAVQNLCKGVAQDAKEAVDAIDSEQKACEVAAELVDAAYKGNVVTEALDYPMALLAFEGVSRYIVPGAAGKDWFARARAWVQSVLG